MRRLCERILGKGSAFLRLSAAEADREERGVEGGRPGGEGRSLRTAEWGRSLWRGWDAALGAAFPAACAGCGGVVEDSSYSSVCRACSSGIRLIGSPKCETCGFPFFGDTESQPHCWHCEHLVPEFGQGWSIALFRGALRELIHALKYQRGFWTLRDIGALVEQAPQLDAYVAEATLVPVPLHPRKLRDRGYNQSFLIAAELAKRFPIRGIEQPIIRVADTVSQTRFNRQERIRNLRNAFSTRPKPAIDAGKRYVIVDDVFTTGSTLNACASALRQAGARRIDVLTVGHG